MENFKPTGASFLLPPLRPVHVGSMDKNLYAVDQQTGALKWKFATEGPVVSSPALAGGIVYSRRGRRHRVFRLPRFERLCRGCQDRQAKVVLLNQGFLGNNSAAVYDGKVFFGTSIPGLLHAAGAKTGAEVFSLDTKFPVFASIAIPTECSISPPLMESSPRWI
jgi:outer membrane protein assembly factor BamB